MHAATSATVVPSTTDLVESARALSEAALQWAHVLAPTERIWHRFDAPYGATAYAIAWPPGSEVPLHDHGGAAGAIFVVLGLLEETVVRRERGREVVSRSRTIRGGEHVTFGRDHVHAVTNRGLTPALSVHVYAPVLRSMTYFATLDSDGLSPLHTEWIEDVM